MVSRLFSVVFECLLEFPVSPSISLLSIQGTLQEMYSVCKAIIFVTFITVRNVPIALLPIRIGTCFVIN